MITEEDLARAAAALLSGVSVVHHQPEYSGDLERGPPDAEYFCDWCARRVRMSEMISGGGDSMWSSHRERGDEVANSVRCWQLP